MFLMFRNPMEADGKYFVAVTERSRFPEIQESKSVADELMDGSLVTWLVCA